MPNAEPEAWYPLKLAPLAKEKVWGGYKLAALYPQAVPGDRPIGEIWVVWDQLPVLNGAWRGTTLADLVRDHPRAILGEALAQGQPALFPLLVKLIDTQETLSVQVHPDDGYAARRAGEPFGKAEAWYILDAEPGARLMHGVRSALTRADAEEAVRSGRLRALLHHVEVLPGDVIMNPAGTVHALGGGFLLYELQQSSDLTYRLYDWDRDDPLRPLHIKESLDVADLEPLDQHVTRPVVLHEPAATRSILFASEPFAAELLEISTHTVQRPAGRRFHILTVLQGTGWLRYGPQGGDGLRLLAGDSVLVPACLEEYRVGAEPGPVVLLKAYVPDLWHDLVVPLRQRGIPDEEIVQLGGDARRSDLARYLCHDGPEPLRGR
jgi:mannose-6-phosphate isomerase